MAKQSAFDKTIAILQVEHELHIKNAEESMRNAQVITDAIQRLQDSVTPKVRKKAKAKSGDSEAATS